MKGLLTWMDRTLYPGVNDHWDDLLFRARIVRHLRPDATVLDLGAGAGIVEQMSFRGLAARICGLDPDPRVASNPYLDEGRVGVGEEIPYPDGTFDLVFADNVLEHLEQPSEVFREVHRVLRPGGVFLTKTPNRRHYVPLVAQLTPHGFHERINRIRGRRDEDTFPTRYRANTPRTIRRLCLEAGFNRVSFEMVESRPEYLRWNPLLYVLGWAWERSVNTVPGLSLFRVLLVAECSK